MKERPEQEQMRFAKLKALKEKGFNYPNDIKVTASSLDVLESPIVDGKSEERLSIAGRIMQLRVMGKAMFAHILDGKGKVQIYIRSSDVGQETYEQCKNFDLGDIIAVKGFPFITKTGEHTLHAESVTLLVKSLIPPPEKWHGLTDEEARYRYRYVDLFSNLEVRERFRKRAEIIRFIRNFLDNRGFLEVETPCLHHVAGGATARPFKTHHNALGIDMYLRIALELPLKKLIVGGLERVYEISRVFRNEGISRKHNPEFTMLEFYQAFATFEDMMDLTEDLICEAAEEINGSLVLPWGEKTIDLKRPWKRISMLDAIHELGGVERSLDLNEVSSLHSIAAKHRVHLEDPSDWGRCLEAVFESLVEEKLIDPIFIMNHPFSISPLARKNLKDPKITDRFELFINGMEMANAFSELNDPVDQRERFEAQARRKIAGDKEACDVDEDFLRALEYGLPPTGGEGMGIDRLVMFLTNVSTIRDVVLFPQLKPEEGELDE
ncbi:MAG: lysine--tRNA ligase [SAR324 cluster bacterium]|uniref:Lysine--tRNA ligase n=1 Tax=SAR324 cluster bacterium TaxID=2024889 RepID=A0A7X9IL23_9DELT|nr:lysine--tRNA ligase [SAR324 cluster bacterium]